MLFPAFFNLLEGFDTGMIADTSLIPSIKKYRRLRVAGILQAMLLGEVELSDRSVYTAAIIICEAMPREPELHCEPTRNALIEMTLSTAVSPSLVPRGGNWLYEMAKVESRWQTFFQAANKNVIRAMQAAVEKGRRYALECTAGRSRGGVQGLGVPASHCPLYPTQGGGRVYEGNLLHLSRCAGKDVVLL